MNRIVLTALCIFGTLGIACDTEPTPAAPGDAGTVVTNTNTDTATSTATGTGGGVSATGGAVTNGTGGAIGTGGAVSGTGGTSASTCPTCTGSNITITVNITGNGGATSNGGTAVTGTGGNVASTGGVTGTGGTSAATTKLCIPGRSLACTSTTQQVCNNDGMSYGPCTALATGGTTGTGGATTSTGGTVSTGGASATGGSTGTGGDINASMTCDTTMPNGTSVSYAFVINWAGRAVDNGLPTARFCFSPAHLIITCDSVMRACPSSATARIYFETAFGSPSASYDQNLSDMPLTADGYCLSGLVDGNYHVSYSYPGIMTAWACYPALAANPALPLSSKQWIEKDPSGSYGLTFKKVGNTYSLGPYGNNY